jgi:hypothetical protein
VKTVVTIDEIREVELRPDSIYDRFFELLEQDVPEYFGDGMLNEREVCPACRSNIYTDQFKKLGFQYRTCDQCGTMFVSRRASDEALARYRKESPSHRFFVEEFLAHFEKGEGMRDLKGRIAWVTDSMVSFSAPSNSYLDLRSKYVYPLREIDRQGIFNSTYFSRPLFDSKLLVGTGFEEKGAFSENEDASVSVITAFEFLDSLFDPEVFVRNAHRVLEENGLLVLTTRNITGFDLQILWESSKSIMPPHHVTLFSIEGLIQFFESNGLKVRELSTPGQLDLGIVQKTLTSHRRSKTPRFFQYLLECRGLDAQRSFKEFLQKNRLSSHTRMVVQKQGS